VDGIAELAIVGIPNKHREGERIACLAVPKRDSIAPPSTDDRHENNQRALGSLRSAIASLPYHQQPAVVHLYDAQLPRTATRKGKRKDVQAILERLVAATTTPEDAAGELGPVRVAIAGVTGRPAQEIRPH